MQAVVKSHISVMMGNRHRAISYRTPFLTVNKLGGYGSEGDAQSDGRDCEWVAKSQPEIEDAGCRMPRDGGGLTSFAKMPCLLELYRDDSI